MESDNLLEKGVKKEAEEEKKSLEGFENKGGIELLGEKYINMGRDLYSRLNSEVSKLLERFVPGFAEKAKQEKLNDKILEMKSGGFDVLNYIKTEGVCAAISQEGFDGQKAKAIEARDFNNCCGVILQAPDSVAVVHVSPYVIDPEDGGPTEYALDIKNKNFRDHIYEAIGQLFPEGVESKESFRQKIQSMYKGWYGDEELAEGKEDGKKRFRRFKDLIQDKPLSEEQLKNAQENLKITIVGGDEMLAGILANIFKNDRSHQTKDGQTADFPSVKSTVSLFGTGPKTIYATSNDILIQEQLGQQKIFEVSEKMDKGLSS